MFQQITLTRTIAGNGSDLLVLGDGSQAQQVLAERAGQAQVVYVDPPFMTGDVFERRRRFGTQGWKTGSPMPAYEGFDDRYPSREAYIEMLRGLIENAWLLLKPDGMLCLHLDWHASHLGRLLCDEIFGADRFVNEVIWAYESGGRSRAHFSRKHDTILLYARSRKYRFDMEKVPLSRGETRRNHMKKSVDEDGRTYRAIRVNGKEYRYYDDEPVYPGDVWTDISHIQQRSPERTGFATQKPLKLLDRLLRPLVEPGDLVVDLSCGSGTTLQAAQQLGCSVLGMDKSPEALLITQSRLDPANLTLMLETTRDDVPLEGHCVSETGAAMLAGQPETHPSFPKHYSGLDPIERWSVGELYGGTMFIRDTFQRTVKHPELETMMVMATPPEQPIGVVTVDAAGVLRAYEWVEE